MLHMLYNRNKRKNRQIALAITAVVALSKFIPLPFSSVVVPLVNKPLLEVLGSFGLAWVAIGIYKHWIGQ